MKRVNLHSSRFLNEVFNAEFAEFQLFKLGFCSLLVLANSAAFVALLNINKRFR